MNLREWLFGKRGFQIVGEISKLDLKKNDIVLITYPSVLSKEQHEYLKKHVSDHIEGHRIFILDHGMKLGVISGGQDNA